MPGLGSLLSHSAHRSPRGANTVQGDRLFRRPEGGSRRRAVPSILATLLIAACVAAPGDQPAAPTGAPETPRPTLRATPTAAQRPAGSPTPGSPTTASPSAGPSDPAALAPTGRTESALVLRVVDGDTIVVDRGQGQERLRYIGVDTPETVHPSQPVQWMGPEASAANRRLVEGRRVVLERDVSETDRYGRLLRYVWLESPEGWAMVNLALLEQGYAQVVTYPPDVKYVALFLAAQAAARDQGRGLWGEPPATPAPTERPAPSDDRGGCDPSYPTVCIPPPPPDLDCGEIDERRFKVVGADPHRFDGDHDGIGCES